MIEFEKGSTNVYADLGFPDAEEMFRKAQLTSEIDKIIKTRRWSRRKAAEVVGIPQPELSAMLRGHFRGIGEMKLLDCPSRGWVATSKSPSAPPAASAAPDLLALDWKNGQDETPVSLGG